MTLVLVATPTWVQDGAPVVQRATLDSVAAQEFGGDFEHRLYTDNPFAPPSLRNVFHQYQRIRAEFLAGAWDALLCMEHDNALPDSGALQRMYDTPAPVVYAPYVFRHGMRVLSTAQRLPAPYTSLGSSLAGYADELAAARAAGSWPVSGVGFGCTLMRRAAVERVPFRGGADGLGLPDMPFAQDCLAAGVMAMGRFDVPVLHYDRGEWLNPYETIMNREYRALQTVNAYTNGKFIAMVEGSTYAMSHEDAYDLLRMGLIVLVGDAGDSGTHAPARKAPRRRRQSDGAPE